MKPVSVLLHECTAEEAKDLPRGFRFLEYDRLYETLRVLSAGFDTVHRDKRYVYLCYKLPLFPGVQEVQDEKRAIQV